MSASTAKKPFSKANLLQSKNPKLSVSVSSTTVRSPSSPKSRNQKSNARNQQNPSSFSRNQPQNPLKKRIRLKPALPVEVRHPLQLVHKTVNRKLDYDDKYSAQANKLPELKLPQNIGSSQSTCNLLGEAGQPMPQTTRAKMQEQGESRSHFFGEMQDGHLTDRNNRSVAADIPKKKRYLMQLDEDFMNDSDSYQQSSYLLGPFRPKVASESKSSPRTSKIDTQLSLLAKRNQKSIENNAKEKFEQYYNSTDIIQYGNDAKHQNDQLSRKVSSELPSNLSSSRDDKQIIPSLLNDDHELDEIKLPSFTEQNIAKKLPLRMKNAIVRRAPVVASENSRYGVKKVSQFAKSDSQKILIQENHTMDQILLSQRSPPNCEISLHSHPSDELSQHNQQGVGSISKFGNDQDQQNQSNLHNLKIDQNPRQKASLNSELDLDNIPSKYLVFDHTASPHNLFQMNENSLIFDKEFKKTTTKRKKARTKVPICRDSSPVVVDIKSGLSTETRIVQPKYMEERGTMCLSELWSLKQKDDYVKAMKSEAVMQRVLQGMNEEPVDSVWRPDKVKNSKDIKSRLKLERSIQINAPSQQIQELAVRRNSIYGDSGDEHEKHDGTAKGRRISKMLHDQQISQASRTYMYSQSARD